MPTLASGRINGLGGAGNIPMELRLQPNDFLHGELVIHEAGYGPTPIQGFIRSDHLEFQAPYGAKTVYFQGQRNADQLSGTFSATPSGQRGTWSAATIDERLTSAALLRAPSAAEFVALRTARLNGLVWRAML